MTKAVLTATQISRGYSIGSLWWSDRKRVEALREVNFTLHANEVVAVVGRSGSGKSTLARCLAGLETPDQGRIERNCAPRGVQLTFPDAALALNPRWSVRKCASEPRSIRGEVEDLSRNDVTKTLRLVGLDDCTFDRRSHELSGGQKQRVVFARALLVPQLSVLILDEPFTGLDWEARQEITKLLKEIQQERSLAMILITHDLNWVQDLASRIVILESGQVAEDRPARDFFRDPISDAARALIGAMLPLEGPV